MADPLSLLREYVSTGRIEEVVLTGDRVDFGGKFSFNKTVPTGYKSQQVRRVARRALGCTPPAAAVCPSLPLASPPPPCCCRTPRFAGQGQLLRLGDVAVLRQARGRQVHRLLQESGQGDRQGGHLRGSQGALEERVCVLCPLALHSCSASRHPHAWPHMDALLSRCSSCSEPPVAAPAHCEHAGLARVPDGPLRPL